MPTLVVFSHLRWTFVHQRPQHLASRLARRMPVLFFEEPEYAPGAPRVERCSPCPGVEVLKPRTPVKAGGFHDAQLPVLRELLEARLAEGIEEPRYAWTHTPMALSLIDAVRPEKVVYDCMDALACFRNAPAQLAEREAALLQRADLVFCGGESLYRARAGSHRNIHCFASSVDAGHFARGAALGDHPLQAHLPHPRLGYCGVIDERVDLALLAQAARARPHWQFVLVGPLAKIDARQVPALPNVHLYGQQPYDALPRFMAGWDAGLLPFALNDATRFISPTKTLEYLAAGLPAVSTPIADVVAGYAGVVEIATDARSLIEACERLWHESEPERAARREAMRARVAATSWDKTAGEMWALIEALPGRAPRAVPGSVERRAERRRPPEDGAAPVAKLA